MNLGKGINDEVPNTVTHVHLQCYAGGNSPCDWQTELSDSELDIKVYPGLAVYDTSYNKLYEPSEITNKLKRCTVSVII